LSLIVIVVASEVGRWLGVRPGTRGEKNVLTLDGAVTRPPRTDDRFHFRHPNHRGEQQLTAFCLIFQAIAIGFYPALFAAGFLERVPMSDHAEMDMPPPILARNILMKAMGCLISTNGEILFRFIKPIRRSGSRNGQAE